MSPTPLPRNHTLLCFYNIFQYISPAHDQSPGCIYYEHEVHWVWIRTLKFSGPADKYSCTSGPADKYSGPADMSS